MRSYIRYRRVPLLFFGIELVIFPFCGYLYGVDGRAIEYSQVLTAFFYLLFTAVDLPRYLRRRRALREAVGNAASGDLALPEPDNAMEAAYQELAAALRRAREDERERGARAQTDMEEYYGLWIHQIKTPLAALALMVPEGDAGAPLRGELFRLERYVQMALNYSRLRDGADLLIERVELDGLVRESVRRYAPLIIRGKLSIKIELDGARAQADRKWTEFVFEQLLSNAVKYTWPGGHIRVGFAEGCLTVADSGVGIRPEDLPRVMEKGYTGALGRSQRRATGIGLYLSDKAARLMGAKLSISSRPGEGSCARLRFAAALEEEPFPAREDDERDGR